MVPVNGTLPYPYVRGGILLKQNPANPRRETGVNGTTPLPRRFNLNNLP
jgi:hypothetical protein